jgi:hypothetical protein
VEARWIYAALFDVRGPVGEPDGMWKHIGDRDHFDVASFELIVQQLDSRRVFIAVSRAHATEVSIEGAAAVVADYMQHGEVRIANVELTKFMQVNRIGVARCWVPAHPRQSS